MLSFHSLLHLVILPIILKMHESIRSLINLLMHVSIHLSLNTSIYPPIHSFIYNCVLGAITKYVRCYYYYLPIYHHPSIHLYVHKTLTRAVEVEHINNIIRASQVPKTLRCTFRYLHPTVPSNLDYQHVFR